jgi:hypothetical protein
MSGFERRVETWECAFPAARVGPGGRYEIPEKTVAYHGEKRMALEFAVLHIAAMVGLPPWKPLRREVAKLATVSKRVELVKLG